MCLKQNVILALLRLKIYIELALRWELRLADWYLASFPDDRLLDDVRCRKDPAAFSQVVLCNESWFDTTEYKHFDHYCKNEHIKLCNNLPEALSLDLLPFISISFSIGALSALSSRLFRIRCTAALAAISVCVIGWILGNGTNSSLARIQKMTRAPANRVEMTIPTIRATIVSLRSSSVGSKR